MLRVRREEECLVIDGLVTSPSPSKRRRGKSMWVMRGFKFRLTFSLSLWVAVLVCGCRLPFFFICSTVEKFVFFSVFIFWSDQIGFPLFFSLRRSRIGRKIIFDYFYFFEKYHRHFAMRWSYAQKPHFPFWRKSQHR